jgi:hypothetical protein
MTVELGEGCEFTTNVSDLAVKDASGATVAYENGKFSTK